MSMVITAAIAGAAFIAGGIVGFSIAKLSDYELPPLEDAYRPETYSQSAKEPPVDYARNNKGGYPVFDTTPPQTAEAVIRNKLAAELRTARRACAQPESCQCKPHQMCTFGSVPK
jgi:hypothetical protein